MKSRTLFCLVSASLLGCSPAMPPQELVDARTAYVQAASGPAGRLTPADLHGAKNALDNAEAAFRDDPSSDMTRDRAYVALRRAQLADARGRIAEANGEKAHADEQVQLTQAVIQKNTERDLDRVRTQLATEAQRTETEARARADAEKRARVAMDDLARIAAIKEESRGTVITLPGSVLFESAKSTLLATAQAKLDQVAEALKESKRSIVVEGHADSQGPAGYNLDLSQRRAQSVRDYLVDRGVPEEQIRARGYGSERPVADNASAEGRANNRRVEIVVEPEKEK
jgi:outer membrane protein OmpA-like peptidoglycan-associated protein